MPALLAAACLLAETVELAAPDAAVISAFMSKLLFAAPAQGGHDMWWAYDNGIIDAAELRNALVARLSTWFSTLSDMPHPWATQHVSQDVQRAFDAALFPSAAGAAVTRLESRA
jgi:hypothetical protein